MNEKVVAGNGILPLKDFNLTVKDNSVCQPRPHRRGVDPVTGVLYSFFELLTFSVELARMSKFRKKEYSAPVTGSRRGVLY